MRFFDNQDGAVLTFAAVAALAVAGVANRARGGANVYAQVTASAPSQWASPQDVAEVALQAAAGVQEQYVIVDVPGHGAFEVDKGLGFVEPLAGGANRGGSAAKKGAEEVSRAWSNGRPKSKGAMLTDGINLFSYDLKIGTTDADGNKILYDYSARTDNFHSSTTSNHVGAARDYADQVVDPGRVSLLG